MQTIPDEFQVMSPWPGLEPFARQVDLPRSGLRLFLYEAGAAHSPPVIFLHGLGDEADTWRHLIGPLSSRRRVIAPDLPGFGRSQMPEGASTPAFFAGVILELLDALAVRQPVLVGNSMGGLLAQLIALEHPGLVRGLALLDGALLARRQPTSLSLLLFLAPGLGELLYNRLRKNPQAAYHTLRPYYADLDGLPEADRKFLYQRVNQRVWSDERRRAYLSTLRGLARTVPGLQRGLVTRLAGLELSTLVIWGEQDRINPLENGRALAQVQPSARLVVFPHTGHLPHQERPAETLQALLADERLF